MRTTFTRGARGARKNTAACEVQTEAEPRAIDRLWELEPREAARAKWEAGRARYGEVWVGRHPLIELYDELLDAFNYNRMMGDEAPLEGAALLAIARTVSAKLREEMQKGLLA